MYGEIGRPGAKGGTHTQTSHARLGMLLSAIATAKKPNGKPLSADQRAATLASAGAKHRGEEANTSNRGPARLRRKVGEHSKLQTEEKDRGNERTWAAVPRAGGKNSVRHNRKALNVISTALTSLSSPSPLKTDQQRTRQGVRMQSEYGHKGRKTTVIKDVLSTAPQHDGIDLPELVQEEGGRYVMTKYTKNLKQLEDCEGGLHVARSPRRGRQAGTPAGNGVTWTAAESHSVEPWSQGGA